MSTVQRWQTPACLSLVLIAAILFVFSLGLRIDARAAAGPATVPVDATTPAATPTTVQCLVPAATAAPAAPVVPATPVPAPFAISQNVSGSSNLSVAGRGNTTQGSDGGFGDVGMQFQNVNVLAPINIIHISNQGSGNTNTVNIPPVGPVTTTSTPATAAPATAVPATVDPATTTTATTTPPTTTTTAGALPAKVWTPPTTPATSSAPDAATTTP